MARKRLISPEFFQHEVASLMHPNAQLLYIGLWCQADRRGYFELRPMRLKAAIFPHTDIAVVEHLATLIDTGFVSVFSRDGKHFGVIPSFERWQTFHPSEKANPHIPEPLSSADVGHSLPDTLYVPDITRVDTGVKQPVTVTVTVTGTGLSRPDVEKVAACYLATHPRRRIVDESARRTIVRALKMGFSADELCDAVRGNATDTWCITNGRHDLSYSLRDAGSIDRFREHAERPDVDSDGVPNAAMLRLSGT